MVDCGARWLDLIQPFVAAIDLPLFLDFFLCLQNWRLWGDFHILAANSHRFGYVLHLSRYFFFDFSFFLWVWIKAGDGGERQLLHLVSHYCLIVIIVYCTLFISWCRGGERPHFSYFFCLWIKPSQTSSIYTHRWVRHLYLTHIVGHVALLTFKSLCHAYTTTRHHHLLHHCKYEMMLVRCWWEDRAIRIMTNNYTTKI